MRHNLLALVIVGFLMPLTACGPGRMVSQANAGWLHKDTVVEQPLDTNHLVEAVPQGALRPAKKESFAKQIARGGVFSVGVGIVAGAIKLGIFAVTGIPII